MTVQTGLDRVAVGEINLKGQRVGVLAHAASVDRRFVHAVDVIREAGAEIRVLFGPEHGLSGAAQDMIGVDDDAAAIPVRSLYGETAADLHPRPEDLQDLDGVIIDLQDVGSRYYTYVWTAAMMLRAASRLGVRTMVLDRPNPLGGEVVEGMPQRGGYRSFIGFYPVAVRHGLTIAEMLDRVVHEEKLDSAALEVVEMRGWRRNMWFDETGLPWVMPSPNMPSLSTAIVYPGGCVIEGTTLSEGRGTTRPFEIFGAPGVRGDRLTPVEGAVLRSIGFEPTFQKHAKQLCGGVQVHVTDRTRFRSYWAYLGWVAQMLEQREAFAWRTEVYEYETERAAIDLLTGGPEYRQLVNAGKSLEDYLARDAEGAAAFRESRVLRY